MCVGVQILRKFVEMECPLTTPAADWVTSDWSTWAVAIERMQDTVVSVPSVVPLLCRIIATCNDVEMLQEAVYVVAALLLGGNRNAQKAFLAAMRNSPGTVVALQERVRDTAAFAKKRKKAVKSRSVTHTEGENFEEEDAAQMALTTSILRALQLSCEGHNLRFQRFLSLQPGSAKSVNLVGAAVSLFVVLEKAADRAMMPLMNQTIDFLVESLQGVCWYQHPFRARSARLMAVQGRVSRTSVLPWRIAPWRRARV